MFGLAELPLSSPQGIPLVTSKGNPIANHQGADVAVGKIQAFEDMCRRNQWCFRRHAGGRYNCAGLVWASRRTGISQTDDWRRILTDDGYRETSRPQIDDLVLYRDVDDNTYLHVARIISFTPGLTPESEQLPVVLSKWGHDLGECFHLARDHRLPAAYNVKEEYWTERPRNESNSTTT
jgi:hypothetical protein